MEKKKYIAPKMDVVDMQAEAMLLAGSGEAAPPATLYSDEFGYNYNPENDNRA